MNCAHRGHGRGYCDRCKERRRARNAASFARRLEALVQAIARCTHERAERYRLFWCDVCGAMRPMPANGTTGPWTLPIGTARAKALDRKPNPPGVIDATYEDA